MAQLLLVNPRKRRRKAAKRTAKRRRNPAPALLGLKSNPRKRRSSRRRRNPIVARRRNPIPGMSGISATIMDAVVGAGGAVGVNWLMAQSFIPANLKTGNMAPLVKAAAAMGIGLVMAKGLRQPSLGRKLTSGALTVIAYDAIKANFGTSLGLGAFEYSGGMSGMGAYEVSLNGMGSSNLLGFSQPNAFDASFTNLNGYENAAPLGSVGTFDYGSTGDY